jgi:type III restriction enzyme
VNALKEGWDCSFAYILATLANKTSRVDVEQIVGRVLRQPHADKHSQPLLNNAYVLTCSNDFSETVEHIRKSLNKVGFDKKSVRYPEENQQPAFEAQVPAPVPPQSLFQEPPKDETEEFLGDYGEAIRHALEGKPSSAVEEIAQMAVNETLNYEQEEEESERLGYLGGLEGAMKNQYSMSKAFSKEAAELRIPQFCFYTEPDLFHDEKYTKITKEKLSLDFSLNNADSNINFSLASGDMYEIYATDEEGARKRKMTANESEYIRTQMARLPEEGRRKLCVGLIVDHLDRREIGDVIIRDDLRAYVERIVSSLSNDDLTALQTGYQFYASRIHQKIKDLLSEHRKKRFLKMLAGHEILCRPMFELKNIITPVDTFDGLEKSLYESEAAVNSTEQKIIEEIAALPNVKWWHRIAESKPYSFCINGFITHYPDFMVMTNKGHLAIVEVKGDDRDNSDSERKLLLGSKWSESAGENFSYFMVFDKLNWNKEGAYDLSEFVRVMGKL